MATVEGIRTPIIIDLTDIPRSVAAVEKEIKRLQKKVGEVDLKLDGKSIKNLSKESLRPLIREFAKLEDMAKNAKARMNELGRALEKVRSGAEISDKKIAQIGAMRGVGAKTRAAITDYSEKQAAAVGSPHDPAKQQAMVAAQQKLVTLLKKAQGFQQGIITQTKQHMQLTATHAAQQQKNLTVMQSLRKQNLQTQKKTHQEYLRLMQLAKQGMITKKEEIQLGNAYLVLAKRRVKIRGDELAIAREAAKTAKKASGGGLMGGSMGGRVKWFLQLRALWGMYRVAGQLTEQLLELDEATAKAMRTMVRGTKDYGKVAEQVRKTIVQTARMTGAAYKDVGEALYQLSSAGLSTKESLAAVNSVVKLSKITGADMTDTTKLVAGAYNNFKDSITGASNETEKFMKISSTLDYVWKRNQVDMNELVQGLNQSAQSGKLAGLSFEQLSVILGNMGTRMIRSGRAGRMLRSAVINIAQKSSEVQKVFGITFDPKKPMNFVEILGKMHTKWKDSNKSAATTAAIFDIFGKRGAPALISILDSWEKIKEEMDGIGSAYDMAIEQHKTMIKLQTHYKELTNVVKKEMVSWFTDMLDYTKIFKAALLSTADLFRGMKVSAESGRSLSELTEKYKDAGTVTERLIELEAHRQLKLEEGIEPHENVIKMYDKLIKKLKDLKVRYDAIEQSEKDLKEARQRNVTRDMKAMSDGYKETDEQLRTWAIEQKLVTPTLTEQREEVAKYADTFKDLRKEYAQYAALLAKKEIAKMPEGIEQKLKTAQQKYLQATKDYWAAVNEQRTATQQAQMERDPHMGQQETEAAKQSRTATGQASYFKMSTGIEMRELEHKQKLLDIETQLDEKYTARNLSQNEQDELQRLREVEKLEKQNEYIDKQLAFNQTQQMLEDQGAEAAIDPEQRQTHLDNLNQLMLQEQELQRQRELNEAKQKAAAMSYNDFQRKRIQGIYEEKGAVAAGKEMWKAYGDTIGSYASSMADQWAAMFAEMGKESLHGICTRP